MVAWIILPLLRLVFRFQCIMPEAMSGLRNIHNICPPEVLKFLLDLFKYNDNSKVRWFLLKRFLGNACLH